MIFEGFENATFPAQPTSTYYTRTASGSGLANLNTAQFDSGSQSYLIDHTGTSSSLTIDFTTTTTNLCTAGGFRFAVRANEDIGSWVAGIYEGTANFANIVVGMSSNVVTYTNDNSAGAVTNTANGLAIPTTASTSWAHYGITCNGGNSVIFINYDNSASVELTGTGGGTITPTIIKFISQGDGVNAPAIHIDNLQWGLATSKTSFCTDPSIINYDENPATPTTTTGASDDYGYNYRRGGTFFDQEDGDVLGIGLSTGFLYDGTSAESTWDYSAKSFSVGTKALHENLTFEAATDTTSSVFRVNFHTAVGSNADDTSKGNGLTTGHFADHLEAQFMEEGDTWRIGFYYVNGGARTLIGQTLTFGDANDATQFTVWLDTRSTASAITTFDAAFGTSNWYTPGGGATSAGPFIAITTISTSGGPTGQDVAKLAIRYLADIGGAPFTDDTVGDVWNVGYSTSIVSAFTAVDENDQAGRSNTGDEGGTDSTCIFDDAGTMVLAGASGGTPESQLPTQPEEDDTPPVGGINGLGGLSTIALNGFLGLVLAACFAASMNERTGAGAAGLAMFLVIGICIAYYLGYIEAWIVVLLGVLGAGAMFFGIKNAVKGSGL